MLANPKTSIPGVLIAAAAGLYIVIKALRGEAPDFPSLIALLAGIGLVGARDGGR